MEPTKLIELNYEARIFPLFTRQDLAARWGVSVQVVNNWSRRRTDFPKEIKGAALGSRPVCFYPLYEVERYERQRGVTPVEIDRECM